MSSPSYTVTRSPPSLVPPAAPTPGGTLPLSSIDKTAAVRVSVDFIQVFPSRPGAAPGAAAAAVRNGIAKALVAYYPVAGRVVEIDADELEVACTGEGVWVVDAVAGCSLEEVKQLERPLMIPKEELLPRPPPDVVLHDLIFMAQVTEFTCGGIAMGICFNHLVFDGQGTAQFLKAVGEVARGFPEPTVKPVWSRDSIPNPPKLPRGPPPSITSFDFVTMVVDISPDSITRVKDDVESKTGQKISTFDVVTAMVLKYRAMAIDLPPEAHIRLGFAASTRHLLQGVLPSVEGYYGNCVYPVGIARESKEIKNATLIEVVMLIREAKETLGTRFIDWMNGGAKENHYNLPLDYGTLTVSDWSRVGFTEVDYGWGEPSYVFTMNDDVNIVASAIYLKPPAPKQGIRLMLRCVEKRHSEAFRKEFAQVLAD